MPVTGILESREMKGITCWSKKELHLASRFLARGAMRKQSRKEHIKQWRQFPAQKLSKRFLAGTDPELPKELVQFNRRSLRQVVAIIT